MKPSVLISALSLAAGLNLALPAAAQSESNARQPTQPKALNVVFSDGFSDVLNPFSLELDYESLGVPVLGLGVWYQLPFSWSGELRAGLSYATNRPLIGLAPRQMPVDVFSIGLQYPFQILPWLSPYLGLSGRLAHFSLDTQFQPELSGLAGSSAGLSLELGSLIRIWQGLQGQLQLNLNYPASLALPYFSWGLGLRYDF